jgi:hypothetical protein
VSPAYSTGLLDCTASEDGSGSAKSDVEFTGGTGGMGVGTDGGFAPSVGG